MNSSIKSLESSEHAILMFSNFALYPSSFLMRKGMEYTTRICFFEGYNLGQFKARLNKRLLDKRVTILVAINSKLFMAINVL